LSVWLIGNRGMLGTEVESLLHRNKIPCLSSDQEVDISDKTALQAFVREHHEKNIDWIINCSGYTAVDRAEDEPEQAFRINAEGVLHIAETTKALGAALIHISTDYVFAGDKNRTYREDDPPSPVGIYAKSKLQGELHVRRTLHKYYILRTAWLYGSRGDNFVRTMLRLFQERDTVQVVSDQWGNPTYTQDLADMILYLAGGDKRHYGVYHYTNEGKTNWCEFAREIYRQARQIGLVSREARIVPVTTGEYPTRAKRPQYSCLSKQKVRKTFGISIRRWANALRACIEEIGKVP